MTTYAVKDIEANPFRHIDRYPIRPDKIEALRESLRTTGFWDNVVARAANGKAEIAYGHHRLAALKEEFGPNHKVALIIRDLDDDTMIKIMARENMEEWGTSASVEHETIRAVVEAYAEGLIHLPAPHPSTAKTQIRHAPSFIAGGEPPRAHRVVAYNAQTIGDFIGWVEPGGKPLKKVSDALAALDFIEDGLLKESDFESLTTKQAQAVIEEARKAKKRREEAARIHRQQAEEAERKAKAAEQHRQKAEKARLNEEKKAAAARDVQARRKAEQEAARLAEEQRKAEETRHRAVQRQKEEQRKERASVQEGRRAAKTVGRAVSSELKSGKIGYRQAADVAIKTEANKANGPPPGVDDFARRLATDLNRILDPDRDQRVAKLEQLVKFRDHLDDAIRHDLARTLEVVANRALDHARQISGVESAKERQLPDRR